MKLPVFKPRERRHLLLSPVVCFLVEYGTILFNLCVCVCVYVCVRVHLCVTHCDCVRAWCVRACLHVCGVSAYVCVCVLSSWHSLTNVSSIQIFHSDGKRSLGSVANF